MKQKQHLYFENLDTLRFFCFLSVFFYHGFYTEFDYISENQIYIGLKDFFRNGMLGVNFFFVLSGFLITFLLLKEKEKNGTINVRHFYIRRVLRIWPLFFFCVIFGFLLFPIVKQFFGETSNETANLWTYLLFVNNFDFINNGLPDSSSLSVLWSLAIEEQFYFIWPLLMFITPVKYYKYLMFLIITSSLIFRIYFDNNLYHTYHSLSCFNDMAMGGLGALLTYKDTKFKYYISKTPKIVSLIPYLLLIIIFLFWDKMIVNDYFRPFERVFTSMVFILIILDQSFSTERLFKSGKIKIFSSLGKITYGLYCLHMIGILITIKISALTGMNKYLWVVLIAETVASLLITIILAKISFKYFETPFLKLKEKFSMVK